MAETPSAGRLDDRMQVKIVHDGSDHIARWVDGGRLPFPLEIQAFDDGSPRAALQKLAGGLTEFGIPCSVGDFLITDEATNLLDADFVGHYRDEDGMAHTLCETHAGDFGEDLEELAPFADAVYEECATRQPSYRLLTDEEISRAVALGPAPPFPDPHRARELARTPLRIPDPAAPSAGRVAAPSSEDASDDEPPETA